MSLQLSSGKSRKTSLKKIKENKAGLSKHRQKLLDRAPKTGDWASLSCGTIEIIDLAYLTAKTGHEFALLKGKDREILFHGESQKCEFDNILSDMLKERKLRLEAHSHPNEEIPIPSPDDRRVLEEIGQKKSVIVSAVTGWTVEFTKSQF